MDLLQKGGLYEDQLYLVFRKDNDFVAIFGVYNTTIYRLLDTLSLPREVMLQFCFEMGIRMVIPQILI